MTAAVAGQGGPGYPVGVNFDEGAQINRLWGIPLLGHAARFVVLLPHVIALWIIGLVVGLSFMVLWIPILIQGRTPGWATTLIGGSIAWSTRVLAYWLLLTDSYPPFGIGVDHPVVVTIPWRPPINGFWGIPLLGYWARALVLIPHAIVLWFLCLGVAFGVLFAWIPVLLNGRMAQWGYDVFGGWLRWTARVTAYASFQTDVYPPFRLGD
ncbi:MAG: DUF4389 domain-containing protein [Chloroflexi bacterium]|nr:DUF4389 domain-containing protein [Chloroflexota bacterium]